MHNAAFEALKLDYIFLAFKVKPAELENAVNGMRALNIRGLNVTMPHKNAVIKYLDRSRLISPNHKFSQHYLKQGKQTFRLQHRRCRSIKSS